MRKAYKISKSFTFPNRSRCSVCGCFPDIISNPLVNGVPVYFYKHAVRRMKTVYNKAYVMTHVPVRGMTTIYRNRRAKRGESTRFHKNSKDNLSINHSAITSYSLCCLSCLKTKWGFDWNNGSAPEINNRRSKY
jgi:hypothetical protein